MSTIVATLLIIMLTLVAVGIIWVVVRNVIQGGAEQVSLGKFTLNLEIKNVVMDPVNLNKINVTVKRNVGDGEIAGLKFIIDDGENTEVIEVTNFSLDELQEKEINLSLTEIQNSSKIQKISVAPIFKLESGKAVTGDVKDEYEIFEGSESGVIPCTPNCVGKQCGSDGCTGTCGTCPTGTCNASFQCVASTIYEENFEGTFPPTGWKTGGDISWNKNTTYVMSGSASAASGAVEGAYKRSWINYTRNFPYGGYIFFYWNVSSEAGYDFLCFCKDKECGSTGCTCYYTSGTADARISSSSDGVWRPGYVNQTVTAGDHFFTWCYATDSGLDPGAHMGIIDNVTFIANSSASSTPSWQTGMVSWWRFNGNANDYYGRNNGTVNGSTLISTGCKSGQCYSFDGVNDYINVNNSQSLNITKNITIAAWIKWNTADDFSGFVMKTTNSAWIDGYGLYAHSDNTVDFYVVEFSTNVAKKSFTADGMWHHVVGTYNGSNVRIYVDGVEGTPDSYSGDITTTNTPLFIGQGDSSENFNGSIDEVMIWNRPLNSTEIQQIYNYAYP